VIRLAVLVDGARTLDITDDLSKLDLGYPDPRAVEDDRTQADGVEDTTAHHGARAVTAELFLLSSERPGAKIDALRAFCHPGKRPYLVVDDEDWPGPRRVRLRADAQSAPHESSLVGNRAVAVSWRAPDGVMFSTDARDASVSPGGGEIGRTYPLVYKRTRVYPAGGGLGTVRMEVGGTAPAQPISRLYGPFGGAGKRTGWANESTGERLEFDGLQVAAGDYVELDHRERTVRLNGNTDAASNRYRFLDFSVSSWWALEPGQDNTLRFYPDVWNAPAQARIEAEDTWL
jgi:hypothetical protein